MKFPALPAALSLALAAVAAPGQTGAPFLRSGDLLVTDTGHDAVFRCADLDLDGDFDGPGEIVLFFASPTTPASIGLPGPSGLGLSTPTAIAVGPDGAAYIGDSGTDQVLRLQDLNGDGDAQDAGEAVLWFGSTGTAVPNASGVGVPSILGMAVAADGAVYLSNSGVSAAPTDAIFRLVDLNADGDAQDAGEATIFVTVSTSSTGGASVPGAAAVDKNGVVYYAENGTTATRGVWRCEDLDFDGDADDAGERTLFWAIPPAVGTTGFAMYGLAFDRSGRLFGTDHSGDRILVAQDLDASLTVGPGEETVFFTTSSSTIWSVAIGQDVFGADVAFAVESSTPERVYRLQDLNADLDALDGSEFALAYQTGVASVALSSPRACAVMKAPALAAFPLPATLGQPLSLSCEAGAGELFDVFLSIGPGGYVVAPYGLVGLDLSPGAFVELLPLFVVPPTGEATFAFLTPNDPALLAATFFVQAIGGPAARLTLSNAVVLTFQ